MRKRPWFGRPAAAVLVTIAMFGSLTTAVTAQEQDQTRAFIEAGGVRIPAPTFAVTKAAPMIDGLIYKGRAFIRNATSPDGKSYCLDAFASGGGALNSPVGVWECNGGPTLAWNVYETGASSGYNLRLINYQWNRSLDYPASSNGDMYHQYRLYDYVDSPGQRFLRTYYSGGPFYAISVELSPNGVMEAIYSGVPNGSPVIVSPWSTSHNQRWIFHHF